MILVTGASGTVGSEVLKALGGQGGRVRAAYRSRPAQAPAGVETVALDFDKPDTVRPALQGVETLFLLSNTVEVERRVVDEARKAGVRRVVKLSVLGAERKEYTFARWHRAVEEHIEASGLTWTFLRPNGFMQNFVTYMGATIRAQGAIYSSAGPGAVSHVDARDIGAAAAQALTGRGHEGKAYDLTGPAALTYDQAAKTLSDVLGREIRYVPISHEQNKQGAMAAGVPEDYAEAMVDLNRHYEKGGGSRVAGGVKQLTGREPRAFATFARDHADKLRPATS